MRRVLIRLAAGVMVVGVVAACSGSDGGDGDDPVPVGGINGPARVDPDSGGASNDSGGD